MRWTRDEMAARAARNLRDGFYVNLGIGIPTLVGNHIQPGLDVTLHSENGILGLGPFPTEAQVDPDIINAGKQTITELDRTSYVSSADSFGMIRRACTLPLTGVNVVDMLITDLAVFERRNRESPFELIECAPGVSADRIRESTEGYYIGKGLA